MQIIRDLPALRKAVAGLKKECGKLAFVPTMGALHAGHMALIAEAGRKADHVVASIFVNPTQFALNEDFSTYPRREAEDMHMLEKGGCALLWAPDVETMYPPGHSTTINVTGVSDGLDGAARPGHFTGVATIVYTLLNQVQPDIALFGEKDFQQLAVIRRMVRDMDLPVEIDGVPTQRDADGIALSSRNIYLSKEQRIAARALPRALGEAAKAIQEGGDIREHTERATDTLRRAGFDPIDYVAVCDAETLESLTSLTRPARILAAARIGQTRLIDNLPVIPSV
ncbi:MAG: pantoate--beta-alanine ligase [Sphingosinicella sp.]|nr:pantoate--beta-alanine ligase [Sphingosinicella sp.]